MECGTFKNKISDYLDGSLEAFEKSDFETHRKVCANCTSELQAFERILAQAKSLDPVQVPDTLWQRIEAELDAPPVPFLAGVRDRLVRFIQAPKELAWPTSPAFKLAGALAVLLIGVIVGRYLVPNGNGDLATPRISPEAANMQLVANRSNQFVEKSKILFLGFINADSTDLKESDWATERQLAQNLVQEAAVLKDDLKQLRNGRLKLLVEELELILLEIANIEKEYDVENIDLIRSGIDQKGLLLKIYLHDLDEKPLFPVQQPVQKEL